MQTERDPGEPGPLPCFLVSPEDRFAAYLMNIISEYFGSGQ
jgi:hypothetical protein